jgi:hypothetical protein
MPDSSVPSAADLSRRAAAALPEGGLGLRLSPPLPAAWPPGLPQLEWFAYRSTALPTGVIAYKVEGPVHKVSLTLPEGQPRAAAVSDGKELGREAGSGTAVPELGSAEQALVEVVLGRRAPDSARADLAPYSQWATASSLVGADLRRRKPEFFGWLDAATP